MRPSSGSPILRMHNRVERYPRAQIINKLPATAKSCKWPRAPMLRGNHQSTHFNWPAMLRRGAFLSVIWTGSPSESDRMTASVGGIDGECPPVGPSNLERVMDMAPSDW
jgi:hypothetical protein